MENRFFKDNVTTGVIISRMQVPYLTESHVNMIETVKSRHPKLLILLGVSKEINSKNPLSFDLRRQMISPLLRGHDLIIPIRDNDTNEEWVKNVDSIVTSFLYVNETAILYGGRDSFIPYYKKDYGKFNTQELLPTDNDSGTELRNIAATNLPIYSRQIAEAIIYTTTNILNI